MKTLVRLFVVSFFTTLAVNAAAQFGSVVVFAPKGEKFTLFMGNTLRNSEPAARVEADNPGGPSFKIRIVFADAAIHEISKLVFNKPHSTMYYKVGKNAKGNYVLESTTSEWMEEGVSSKDNMPAATAEASQAVKKEPKPETDTGAKVKDTKSAGCENPMPEPDFIASLAGVSAHPFEGSQLSAAKKMAETHCLRVSQVKEVIYIFNMESSRLSFAKFAYDFTYDKEDYSSVKDALHSEKSKTELEKFISSKK